MLAQTKSIAKQSAALQEGQVSSVGLASEALSQAEDWSALNAFVALDRTAILDQARAADIRRENNLTISPIDGLLIAVKDNFLTRDYPTTACSQARPVAEPGVDATIVANLRAAGAIIFGKTNMHEWAYGATNTASCFGRTSNPHNLNHITGGSSGGSAAAVAAGIVGCALGSDTGGSVRIPSAACGIYGFKPTYGRASRHGVLPLSWSLDAPGALATSLGDIEMVLPYILGPDRHDPSTVQARAFQQHDSVQSYQLLSLSGEGLERSEVVEAAITAALARTGVARVDARIDTAHSFFSAWEAILHSEATSYHSGQLAQDASGFSPVTRAHLEAGKQLTAMEILKAQKMRSEFSALLLHELGNWDALVLPTLPVAVPRHGQDWQEFSGQRATTQDSMTWFCWLGNLAGLPCLTIPVSTDADGLPIGIMLMGRPGQDEKLLAIAKDLEARGLRET